jgi:tripartite-type tricarboxylate transporter receptor subunit TctC
MLSSVTGRREKEGCMYDQGLPRKPGLRLSRRSIVAGIICGAAFASVARPAPAAPNYPIKPVRIVVPYGPGGVGDLTMRLMADKLSDQVKQQFVIENRPSAGGIMAMTEARRAPADGYTLAEIGNGQAIAGPKGVPDDIVQTLSADIDRALAAPDLQQKASRLGMQARGSTPEQMRERLVRDIAKWRQVIDRAGIPKQ